MLKWYDGYSWDGINRVINPFSLLSFFVQQKFGAFWYASGSPKFLIDLIKKNPGEYTNLSDPEVSEIQLDAADFKYRDCGKDASDEDKAALFDKALTEGMDQINTKGYHKKYIGSGKAIYKAVFAFLGRGDIEMRVDE